jgi:monomeric sarcosine oxidase
MPNGWNSSKVWFPKLSIAYTRGNSGDIFMTATYDVMVLGGGIVGAATAYALLNKGQKVLLLEQFEPGHKNGSSHGDGRIVRFNYPEAIYVEMATHSYPAWGRLGAAAGKPLIQKTGLIEYGPANCEQIQDSESQLQRYGLAYEMLDANTANERFPQLHFNDNTMILYQPEGAVAFATPAVLALWQLFREGGGTAITGKRITGIDVSANQVTLTDSEGTAYTAPKVVIAAGGWAKQLLATIGLDLPLTVSQEVLGYFPPKDDSVNHRVGTMPILIDFHAPLYAPFYSLPIVDIGGVKMGWHHTGVEMQPDNERVVPQRILDGMRGWIERSFPHLQPDPLEVVTCLYTNTPDYHFILDKHPQYANVVIGAGFSGHGFKFGPFLGELLAALALDETPSVSLETFALARFHDTVSELEKRTGA